MEKPFDQPSRIGTEISVTGKWVPTQPDGWFWKSAESREMRAEWEAIHAEAKADPGVLSTETLIYLRLVKQTYDWGAGE